MMMFWVVALQVVVAAHATINTYNKEPLVNNFLIYRKNAMYAVEDAPYVRKEGRGSISFKLDFDFPENVAKEKDTLAELSVFPAEAYDYIGIRAPWANETCEKIFCCTEEMAASGKLCNRAGRLIVRKDVPAGMIQTWPVFPSVLGESRQRLSGEYTVPKKGFYYLVISYCNQKPGSLEITGTTRWENPYGFLPGAVYGYLPFYNHMSIAYLLCALVWGIVSFRHWRELLMIQNWMTLVIGFGMIEVYLRYYDFYHFNFYGDRSKTIMLMSIFFLCLKKTVSRLLVLVVSMGFGVVKPSLGETYGRIVVAGAAYFGFSCIQLTVENLSHTHNLTFSGYLLVLPVICLDFVFFLWIFTSISNIIGSLEERRQDTKLQLYRRFRMVLIICVSVGVVWSVFFSYCIMTNYTVEHWESSYQLEAFWDVLYFAVLVMILYLWAPSSNSSVLYAYDKVPTWKHDEEEYGDDLEDNVAVSKGRLKQ